MSLEQELVISYQSLLAYCKDTLKQISSFEITEEQQDFINSNLINLEGLIQESEKYNTILTPRHAFSLAFNKWLSDPKNKEGKTMDQCYADFQVVYNLNDIYTKPRQS